MQPEEVILSVIAMAGFAFLAFPLVRAISERIRPRVDHGIKDDVLTEVRDMRREIAELGERVDFTERLLAKHRDAGSPRLGA